jgi:hypothetical protein
VHNYADGWQPSDAVGSSQARRCLSISDRNRSDGQLPEPMDRLAVEVIPLLSWLTGFAQI